MPAGRVFFSRERFTHTHTPNISPTPPFRRTGSAHSGAHNADKRTRDVIWCAAPHVSMKLYCSFSDNYTCIYVMSGKRTRTQSCCRFCVRAVPVRRYSMRTTAVGGGGAAGRVRTRIWCDALSARCAACGLLISVVRCLCAGHAGHVLIVRQRPLWSVQAHKRYVRADKLRPAADSLRYRVILYGFVGFVEYI